MASSYLPSDSWLKILSLLDYKDLISCSLVSRQLYEIANHPSNWRQLCKKHWLITTCPDNITWKELFCEYFDQYGRYINCYGKIKTAWDEIMEFLKKNCCEIYHSVKEGTTEDELNKMEAKIDCELPNDLRCAYRIHNGQKFTVPGLFGSISTLTHYRSDNFMDLDSVIDGFESKSRFLPITICINTSENTYIALEEFGSIKKHQLFYRHFTVNVFLVARNFTEWFTDYARKLSNNKFPVIDNQISRFEYDPECVCTTGSIEVSVATCFLPELSNIPLPNFCHAYRITMSMHPKALESDSCQLETRHWITIDEDGKTETVNGPGVVGEFPIMRPGQSFSWISWTSFPTTHGSMYGYFKMRKLKTGEFLDVKCPPFHMHCLPYLIMDLKIKEK